MAGIPGQPEVKPSNVNSPVPQLDPLAGPPPPMPKIPQAAAPAQDSLSGPPPQAADQSEGYNGPGSDLLEMSAKAAPVVGAIGGTALGILGGGGVASVPAGAAMAMTGAYAGSAYKQFIMQSVLKRQPVQNLAENIGAMNSDSGEAGAGELLGLGVTKSAQAAIATKTGQAGLEALTKVTSGPLNALKSNAAAAIARITAPLEPLLASKVTPLTSEEVGNSIKQQFTMSIQQKYGGFVESYGNLKSVAQQTPVDEAALSGFTSKLRSYANTLGGDNRRFVLKLADDADQVSSGAGLDSIAQQLRSKSGAAFDSNMHDQGKFFRELTERTNDFLEDRVHNLANRVVKGVAKPGELDAFNNLVTKGGQEEALGLSTTGESGQFARVQQAQDSSKEMRQVASDYLQKRDTVRADYAKFRGMLEDVGEQVKVNPQDSGPMQFLKEIHDVPSEQLAERMFQPKNAAALRTLQAQHPEVFESVMKNKMSDIVSKATSTTGDIDYAAVAKAVDALPPSTSNLLMSGPERKLLMEVAHNPRIALIQSEHNAIANKVALGMARIGEIVRSGVESGAGSKALTKFNAVTGAGIGASIPNAPPQQ